MSTATWGEPEPHNIDGKHPLPLLKRLLPEMIRQFGASGGCIALYDENASKMVICLHMRLRRIPPALTRSKKGGDTVKSNAQQITNDLAGRPSRYPGKMRRMSQPMEADPIITQEKSALFPIGAASPFAQDLIGYTRPKNEPLILRHDDY